MRGNTDLYIAPVPLNIKMKFNELVDYFLNEGKNDPGRGFLIIFAAGGEVMESNFIKLPFVDPYHVRDHSNDSSFHHDDDGKVVDVTQNNIPEQELPIMVSFTGVDLDVEIFPGVYTSLDTIIHIKTCGTEVCTMEPEPIYPVLFTQGGKFYNDAYKAIKLSEYRYLPLKKIYSKLGIK